MGLLTWDSTHWGPLGKSDWEEPSFGAELRQRRRRPRDTSELRVFLARLGRTSHQLESEAYKLYLSSLLELRDYYVCEYISHNSFTHTFIHSQNILSCPLCQALEGHGKMGQTL